MDHDELVAWLREHGIEAKKADLLATSMRAEMVIYKKFDGGALRGTEIH